MTPAKVSHQYQSTLQETRRRQNQASLNLRKDQA